MSTRRGLIAAFFVSLVPSVVRGRKNKGRKYVAVFHDSMGIWKEEFEYVLGRYRAGLAPYGVRIIYEQRKTKGYRVRIRYNDLPSPDGFIGLGWGSWRKEGESRSLAGGVELYPAVPQFGLEMWPAENRLILICHEIGHVFGLQHEPSGTESCMQDRDAGRIGIFISMTEPSQSDLQKIAVNLPRGKRKKK